MNYALHHPYELVTLTFEHVVLVLSTLAVSLAIAFPIGIFVARSPRFGPVVLGALNVLYTVPSLAMLALLIPVFGIGQLTASIALVAYAQMLLVRNIATGLQGVSPVMVDAARGLGMTAAQRFWRVEIPQALPTIIGGIRLATIALIALATLAAFISAGGLGVLVLYGLKHDYPERAIAGSAIAAALAIAADVGLRALERRFARG